MPSSPTIRSRSEARAAGAITYYTGRPCPRGHDSPRYVGNKVCLDCNREWAAERRDRDPDVFRRWRAGNVERDRENSRRWQRENRKRVRAQVNERTSARKTRTPRWVSKPALLGLYVIAQRVSACTGIKHHVDHTLPLRGGTVSGLHVPLNMRVVPAPLNLAKGNRYHESAVAQQRLAPSLVPGATVELP